MKKGVDYIGVGVVFACHDGKGNFLFARRGRGARDGHGLWEIPSGAIEYGETAEECLIRELNEELCMAPKELIFIGVRDAIKRDGEQILRHWIGLDYLVLVDPKEVRIGEPEVCDAIEWYTLEKYPHELHHGSDATIANIKKYLESQQK